MARGIASIPYGTVQFGGRAGAEPSDCRPTVIGRQVEAEPVPFRWRNHERGPAAWCVHYTVAGRGLLRDDRDGTEHAIGAGRAFIVPFPSPTTYWRPPGEAWDFVWLLAEGPLVERHGAALYAAHGPAWDLPPDGAAAKLVHGLHALAASGADDPADGAALCYRLICELWRAHREAVPLPPEVAAACRHAVERLADPGLGVPALARAVGCSQAHLSRLFRQHLGTPPYAWILDRRLRLAMDLLGDGVALREAASRSGFPSYTNFCHRFRARFRVAPSDIRRSG